RDPPRSCPLYVHILVLRNRRGARDTLLCWDEAGYVIIYKKIETEDARTLGFTEAERPAHNQPVRVDESGRLVAGTRKSCARRSVMRKQGSLSVPPRARRQRGRSPSRNSGPS